MLPVVPTASPAFVLPDPLPISSTTLRARSGPSVTACWWLPREHMLNKLPRAPLDDDCRSIRASSRRPGAICRTGPTRLPPRRNGRRRPAADYIVSAAGRPHRDGSRGNPFQGRSADDHLRREASTACICPTAPWSVPSTTHCRRLDPPWWPPRAPRRKLLGVEIRQVVAAPLHADRFVLLPRRRRPRSPAASGTRALRGTLRSRK